MRKGWIITRLTPRQAMVLDILIKAAGIPRSGYTHAEGVVATEGICMPVKLGIITTATVGELYVSTCDKISYEELVNMLTEEIKSKT